MAIAKDTGFEVSPEDLASCLSHPMTIAEAIGALELCINRKCSGKDRKKVRIVLK